MRSIRVRNRLPRLLYRQAGREYEAGTTIFEMLVATFILGVAIAGTAGLLLSASQTSAASRHRTAATRLGVEELEAIRSMPFQAIGIATTDPAFVSEFRGEPTVSNPGENRVEAAGVVESDGLEYQIERHVTWASVTAAGLLVDRAYKTVTVGVTWLDRTGSHTVWHQTGIHERDPDR